MPINLYLKNNKLEIRGCNWLDTERTILDIFYPEDVNG